MYVKYKATDAAGRMVFEDSAGRLWKYDRPGDEPLKEHADLRIAMKKDINGEPGTVFMREYDVEV